MIKRGIPGLATALGCRISKTDEGVVDTDLKLIGQVTIENNEVVPYTETALTIQSLITGSLSLVF